MKHHLPGRLLMAAISFTAAVLWTGCATPLSSLGPISALQEAQTRAQVERQASRDPFPSPGDVGLQ
jgi:hypothetical protein